MEIRESHSNDELVTRRVGRERGDIGQVIGSCLGDKSKQPPISIEESNTMIETSIVSSPSLYLSQDYFCEFKNNTRCIGSKILRKIGYDGHGLEKRSKGITSSIVVEPRVKHEGLDFFGSKEKAMTTNIIFLKEGHVMELANSLEARVEMNEYGSTLPHHPSYGIL